MNDVSPLTRYLSPLKNWWVVIAGAVVLGLAAAWVTLPPSPDDAMAAALEDPDATFRATHILIGDQASGEAINFDLVELLARQGDLTSRVLERMDGQVRTGDIDAVELETDSDLGTIAITTSQPSPDLAAELVTTYAEELQAVVDERASASLRLASERVTEALPELAVEIQLMEEEIATLPEGSTERRLLEAELQLLIEDFASARNEARGLTAELEGQRTRFDTLQEPAPVASDALEAAGLGLPSNPAVRFIALGFLAAVLGALLAFGIDYLDTRIRSRGDAEDAFGLPVIAELPQRSRRQTEEQPVPVVSDPSGSTAEAFRTLRLSVLFAPRWRLTGTSPTHVDGSRVSLGSVAAIERQTEPQALLVTSSATGDGKSTTVANLAASFAESGQRVLVVDADFRRSAVGGLLGVEPGPGLRDLDAPDRSGLQELVVDTEVPGVALLRSGGSGRAPVWFLDAAGELVSHCRSFADVVIFDTGPVTMANETSALIPAVDAVLLVNRAGRLTRAQAGSTIEQLSRISASMAGVVMVGAPGVRRDGGHLIQLPAFPPRKKESVS
jgi:capsular exopolysaccharide synthesis family protein